MRLPWLLALRPLLSFLTSIGAAYVNPSKSPMQRALMADASSAAFLLAALNHAGASVFTRSLMHSKTHCTLALRLLPTLSDSRLVRLTPAAMTSSSSRCASSASGNRVKFRAIIKSTLSLGSGAPLSHGERGGGDWGSRSKGKGPDRPMYLHPPQVPGTPDRALGGGAGRSGPFPPASHVAARHVTQRELCGRLARALSRSGGSETTGAGVACLLVALREPGDVRALEGPRLRGGARAAKRP